MNRIIQIVTENLSSLLPDSQQNYKPEDLRSWGFPSFIIQRIQVELERNLAESMHLPKTDWANMQSSEVQEVWQQFIVAIRNQAWLPASYARTVIETAVADVLEMLVEPRKNIPQAIFGNDDKLSREQLNERLKILVVYRHFGRLLTRYMEKKDLDVLTKDRCAQIIKKADEKVVSRYTPLNWAQMLEPLFKLMNEQIDSSLLRLFFEDKKMPRIARKFDFMEKSVNRAVLIETLSSPESLNMEGFEEDQSELFGSGESNSNEVAEKKASKPKIEDEDAGSKNGEAEAEADEEIGFEDESDDNQEQHSDDVPLEENEPEADEDLGEVESAVHSDDLEEEEEPTPLNIKSRESNIEFEHEEATLNTVFAEEHESEQNEHFENGQEAESGLNDYFEEEEAEEAELPAEDESETADKEPEESAGPQPEASVESESEGEEEAPKEKEIEITAAEKQETPMWQRFMSTEELEQLAKEEEEETDNDGFIDDDGFIEEPIFDLTMEKEPTEEEIAELRSVLEDKRSYFVEEIFGGSEMAYEEAIENIASKKGWRDASRYIEKEVFKRNLVDMYSEEAVDFTDRMHNYFMEKKES